MPSPKSRPQSGLGPHPRVPAEPDPPGRRKVPDMQVVTKGWWTLREERQSVEELEKEDRNERKQT